MPEIDLSEANYHRSPKRVSEAIASAVFRQAWQYLAEASGPKEYPTSLSLWGYIRHTSYNLSYLRELTAQYFPSAPEITATAQWSWTAEKDCTMFSFVFWPDLSLIRTAKVIVVAKADKKWV